MKYARSISEAVVLHISYRFLSVMEKKVEQNDALSDNRCRERHSYEILEALSALKRGPNLLQYAHYA